jgi:hypothetical protein
LGQAPAGESRRPDLSLSKGGGGSGRAGGVAAAAGGPCISLGNSAIFALAPPAGWIAGHEDNDYAAEVPVVRHMLILSIAMAVTLTAVAAAPDRLTVRGEAWQKVLERESFHFSESEGNLMFALSQFGGKCQIHMIYDPSDRSQITFKFIKDGTELFEIVGHPHSVFRTEKNILYFAHFSPWGQGCTVSAHDLDSGKKLWETKLDALPLAGHSAYSNEVTMGLSSLTGTEQKDEGIVSITGRESYGDYVEVLDRETGRVLAHRVYARR